MAGCGAAAGGGPGVPEPPQGNHELHGRLHAGSVALLCSKMQYIH